jgi:hypothetical protein
MELPGSGILGADSFREAATTGPLAAGAQGTYRRPFALDVELPGSGILGADSFREAATTGPLAAGAQGTCRRPFALEMQLPGSGTPANRGCGRVRDVLYFRPA